MKKSLIKSIVMGTALALTALLFSCKNPNSPASNKNELAGITVDNGDIIYEFKKDGTANLSVWEFDEILLDSIYKYKVDSSKKLVTITPYKCSNLMFTKSDDLPEEFFTKEEMINSIKNTTTIDSLKAMILDEFEYDESLKYEYNITDETTEEELDEIIYEFLKANFSDRYPDNEINNWDDLLNLHINMTLKRIERAFSKTSICSYEFLEDDQFSLSILIGEKTLKEYYEKQSDVGFYYNDDESKYYFSSYAIEIPELGEYEIQDVTDFDIIISIYNSEIRKFVKTEIPYTADFSTLDKKSVTITFNEKEYTYNQEKIEALFSITNRQ